MKLSVTRVLGQIAVGVWCWILLNLGDAIFLHHERRFWVPFLFGIGIFITVSNLAFEIAACVREALEQ